MASPYLHPSTGTYYLRRKLPQDVRHAFDGRELYKVSLGTKDLTKAKQEFILANAELEKQIIEARSGAIYSPEAAVKQWFGRQRGVDQIGKRRRTVVLMQLDLCVSQHDAPLYSSVSELEHPLFQKEKRHLSPISNWDRLLASDHVLQQKLVDQYDEPDQPGMRWGIWRAWKRPRDQWQSLVDQEVDAMVEAMPAIACERHELITAMIDILIDGFVLHVDRNGDPRVWRSPVKTKFNPDMPFSQVCELWAAQDGIKDKTKREFKVAVADFVSFADDPPIGCVEKYLLDEYCDLAAGLPNALPRKIRALGFRQRVAWAEQERPDAERISPATLKKRATAISAIAGFAHRKNIIKARPMLNVEIEGYDRNGSPRRLFSAEEIKAYFGAPLFTDTQMLLASSTDANHATAAWVSLIAIGIGCRLSEAAQILVDDIQMRDGAWCFIFTQEKHKTGKRDEGKNFKTTTKYTAIPIPEILLDLHLLDFVKNRRAQGHHYLFPDVFAKKHGVQKLSDFLNSHIDKYVTTNENLVFQSLRHWFKAKGRTAMGDERTREVQGHAPQAPSEMYGRGDIPDLKLAIDRIRFDPLPLVEIQKAFSIACELRWREANADAVQCSHEKPELISSLIHAGHPLNYLG